VSAAGVTGAVGPLGPAGASGGGAAAAGVDAAPVDPPLPVSVMLGAAGVVAGVKFDAGVLDFSLPEPLSFFAVGLSFGALVFFFDVFDGAGVFVLGADTSACGFGASVTGIGAITGAGAAAPLLAGGR
jgi:hypothetical protein